MMGKELAHLVRENRLEADAALRSTGRAVVSLERFRVVPVRVVGHNDMS
jgi:hypothetical protein